MKVEFFYTPGCKHCGDGRDALRKLAEALEVELEWRDVDVLQDLDHAMDLGVLTLPALAIDGELVCPPLPSPRQWRDLLRKRAGAEA